MGAVCADARDCRQVMTVGQIGPQKDRRGQKSGSSSDRRVKLRIGSGFLGQRPASIPTNRVCLALPAYRVVRENGRFVAEDLRSTQLLPFEEPISVEVIEFGNGEDLLPRDAGWILNPAKLNRISVVDDITAAGVVVSRLTNAPDVDHDLL
jgi:hypothetical protein